ncbi:MAG: hypothetical protein HQM10_21685 [Candidatus Riflebacteria bacterium]|nr:hypothetical protein [Candidatus Riflebacteria bacterium]
MENIVESIKETLKLIPILKSSYNVKRNTDEDDPILFVGVAETNMIEQLRPVVEEYFGPPYKPAGTGSFWMNLFDSFVKSVGKIRKDQTLFKKDISPNIRLFCAFWPWGSEPVKTSIRIGIMFDSEAEEEELKKKIQNFFR